MSKHKIINILFLTIIIILIINEKSIAAFEPTAIICQTYKGGTASQSLAYINATVNTITGSITWNIGPNTSNTGTYQSVFANKINVSPDGTRTIQSAGTGGNRYLQQILPLCSDRTLPACPNENDENINDKCVPKCDVGTTRINGVCLQCPSGKTSDNYSTGLEECAPFCQHGSMNPPGFQYAAGDQCVVPPCGECEVMGSNGFCLSQATEQQIFDLNTGSCGQRECTENEERDENDQCIAKCDDTAERINGQCVGKCLTNQTRINGQCADNCKEGEIRDYNNICVKPTDPCQPGEIRVNGQCTKPDLECIAPKVIINGLCVEKDPPKDPPEPDCPLGQTRFNGNCVTPDNPCGSGEKRVNGKCTPVDTGTQPADQDGETNPSKDRCPPGKTLNSSNKCEGVGDPEKAEPCPPGYIDVKEDCEKQNVIPQYEEQGLGEAGSFTERYSSAVAHIKQHPIFEIAKLGDISGGTSTMTVNLSERFGGEMQFNMNQLDYIFDVLHVLVSILFSWLGIRIIILKR